MKVHIKGPLYHGNRQDFSVTFLYQIMNFFFPQLYGILLSTGKSGQCPITIEIAQSLMNGNPRGITQVLSFFGHGTVAIILSYQLYKYSYAPALKAVTPFEARGNHLPKDPVDFCELACSLQLSFCRGTTFSCVPVAKKRNNSILAAFH